MTGALQPDQLTSGRFRDILDVLPAAIYTTDAEGNLTYFNPACIQLSGRRPTLGSDRWCVTWKLYYPDGKRMPHDECPMAVALKEGRIIRGVEAIAERPDGSRIWFTPYPIALRDAAGKIIGGINMLVDITDRKCNEEALRHSEQKLQRVLETEAVAVLFFDRQGTVIGANDIFLRMTGYRREQIDRRELTWRTMTPPEWVESSEKQMEQFAQTGRIGPYEKEYFLADGKRRWMRFAGRDLGDGTIAEFCIDITESKRREADSRALAALGCEMIAADQPQAIYQKMVEAAAVIMHSDFATMQLFHPDRGEAGELELLAQRGFDPEVARFWQWVSGKSTCVCGLTLRDGARVIIPDAARYERLDDGQKAAYRTAGILAMQSTPLTSRSGRLLGMISTHWSRPCQPTESELSNFDILARQAADVIERSLTEQAIRQNEAWLAAQKEALQSAINGDSLEQSLDVLIRGAIDRFGHPTRSAFYLANAQGTALYHVVGMGAEYAHVIDGFKVGPGSLSCGLATHTGQPVLTADVLDEPRWKPWLWAAHKFDFRGCWSFPLHTLHGKLLGTFAVYWREPRRPTEQDVSFASAVADIGSIIVSRHNEARVRQQTEDALRESEQQLSAMFAQAGVGVAMLRTDDCLILRVNPTFCQIVGYSEEELAGKSCLDLTHADDLPESKRCLGGLLTGSQRTATIEKRYVRKDGSAVWVRVNLAKLADRDGKRSVAMIEDITEQHLATIGLAKAKEEAEAANIAKDNFLATLSHELRTPLTPVLATLSSWEARRSFPREFADDLEVVRRNVDLEARLIDDLLDLTRIAKGKFVLNMETLDVQKVLDAVITMYRADIKAKRIKLSVRLDAGECYVRGDPGRLQQVFWNILKNAVKFTPEDGSIAIATHNGRQGHVQITFTDSGIGISQEMLGRLFQPFEQETAGRYGGLGLGLVITKTILEAQQGVIEAKSDGPGKGASITITLPCVQQSLEAPPASPEPRESDGQSTDSGYRVLLVEDHVDTARVLARLLAINEHTVTTTHSIAEALHALQQDDFDILVSDIGLPDGTGIDLIHAVRDDLRKQMPAIALTGFGMDEDVKRTLKAGFNDHLTKPINFARLEETIQRACKR
ncbi:MAG TPA: PAS domain S-box protein [Tepidisphaeraceae bacterium]|nr:PAS domain S-box protein [Tepidisphaeraceae bacterium]